MKTLFTSLFLFVFLFSHAQLGRLWGTFVNASDGYYYSRSVADESDNLYVTGTTNLSTNIATPGAFSTTLQGSSDAYLTKFGPNGQVVWSTYFGGSSSESTYYLAYSNGRIILAGTTGSTGNFAFNSNYTPAVSGTNRSFFAVFDTEGELIRASYFPYLSQLGCDINEQGEVIVCGATQETGLATTGVYGTENFGSSDQLLMKFSADGFLLWSTYFGGEGNDSGRANICRFDSQGNIALIGETNSHTQIASPNAFQASLPGWDAYSLAQFDPNGQLNWSTYFGGYGSDLLYNGFVDSQDNIYLVGESTSDSIASPGAFQSEVLSEMTYDGIVAKFSPDGQRLWSTYYGGTRHEEIYGVDVDAAGNVLVSGYTDSDHMASDGCYRENLASDSITDLFFVKFDPSGHRLWASYYGGSKNEHYGYIHFGNNGNFYLCGISRSDNGITTPGAHQEERQGNTNTFVVKFHDKSWYNGLDEKMLPEALLFPNPASTGFQLAQDYLGKKVEIRVFDLGGKLVHENAFPAYSGEHIRPQLSAGLYTVQLLSDEAIKSTRLMID